MAVADLNRPEKWLTWKASSSVVGKASQSIQPDERRLAAVVIDRVDDLVKELGEGAAPLRQAREVWGRMRRLERAEGRVENAANGDG